MADFFDDANKMDEDDDIIVLHNETTDKDEEFYHLATLDVDDKWYIVMKPVEKLEDISDDEVLIYEIVEDEDGNDTFAPIEDENQLEKVFNEFMAELEKYDDECGCCHGEYDHDGCNCNHDECEHDGCDCNRGGCHCGE